MEIMNFTVCTENNIYLIPVTLSGSDFCLNSFIVSTIRLWTTKLCTKKSSTNGHAVKINQTSLLKQENCK